MLWSYNLCSIYRATNYLNVIMLTRSLTHTFTCQVLLFYELLSQGVTMYNMGSSSFIMKYIIINVYVHNYSKNCLFTWIELVLITIQKGRHLKTVVASCQPLNSLRNITFVAFTSASNFNNFYRHYWKRNLCKLPSLNVHSTEKFIDITGNDNIFL